MDITVIYDQTIHERDELLLDKYILKRYEFGKRGITVNTSNLSDLFTEIKRIAPDIKKYSFTINEDDRIDEVWESEESHCIFDVFSNNPSRYCVIDIFTNDINVLQELVNLTKKYVTSEEEITVVYTTISLIGDKLSSRSEYFNIDYFKNISDKFYPFIDVPQFIRYFLRSKESILVLAGDPGIGKTHFINTILKHIINNPTIFHNVDDNNVAARTGAVKNNHVLAMDQFWLDIAPNMDLLVFDDLDFFLTTRTAQELSGSDVLKNQFLSHILSFTDGVQENNTKIIVTTNQPLKDIDEALLRRGRLFGVYNFRPLYYEEAKAIWKDSELDMKKFEELFGDREVIYQSDLGTAIEDYRATREYIDKSKFILDSSIDALSKSKPRKVGFQN